MNETDIYRLLTSTKLMNDGWTESFYSITGQMTFPDGRFCVLCNKAKQVEKKRVD
jgi:hypothetical protein